MSSICSTAQHAIQLCDTAIDWSATGDFMSPFATIVAGIAAVVGAIYVARRQNLILAQQARLQELSYRSELFDRQTVVYLTMRRFMAAILSETTSGEDALDEWIDYREAYETARFIFSKKLFLEISAIDKQIDATRRALRYAGWDQHDEKAAMEAHAEYERKKFDLRRHYLAMPAMFDKEINLRHSVESVADFYAEHQQSDAPDEIGVKVIER
ncbi:hypothetical protein [Sphingobium yanoikuyae]|uniref:hypothetical protein n=1 Tax=Sphingobium yanoikuyae TaxID=13690 RepID=UPI0028AD2F55|nr:hypothetical protein [Sphingobium yanoikuyae]